MRHLAAAVVSIGLLVGAWAALTPISIPVQAWEDGRCGPPVVRYFAQETVDDENQQAIIDRCETAAEDRLVVGASAVAAGVLAGLLAVMAAWRHEAVERKRKRARRLERAERERAEQATAVQAARRAQADAANALVTPPR